MFDGLFMTEYQRFLRRAWAVRPELSDDEFHDRFYAGTGIRREIPSRVRHALEQALGANLASVHPCDNLALGFRDVDLADIFFRLERVFHIQIPREVCPSEIDGTFDSLVRYVATALHESG